MTDLASTAAGGRIVGCNDEFFAEAVNLLKPEPPVWKENEYTDHGKWMDGWETRRRRNEGHDWCVVALGIPGRIEKVSIDTSFFTGNFPEEFSLEGCGVGSDDDIDSAYWVELVPQARLAGDSKAVFDVKERGRITHVRLNIYPDGGVARLRVEGRPIPGMSEVCPESGLVNLASQLVGSEAVDASDAHYSPPSNMLRPSDPVGMWDGWETQRRRGPGNDWVSFRLGLRGEVHGIIVDTRYFKGNSPGWISIDASLDGDNWVSALPRTAVEADMVNHLTLDKAASAEWVKLDIYPDGGVARFAVMGRPDPIAATSKRVQYLNSLLGQPATRFFHAACSSTRWVSEMLSERPIDSVDQLLEAAESAFVGLEEDDWLEAFASHPRIGERGDRVANREQAGTADAADSTLAALEEVNAHYEKKFGFDYIVFASGKSGTEMLDIARERIDNDREMEIKVAAGEQKKISATRLRRMMCVSGTK